MLKFLGNIRVILGVCLGFMGDNGKENGNYYLGFRGLGLIVPLR